MNVSDTTTNSARRTEPKESLIQIATLELMARKLEPDLAVRKQIAGEAVDYIDQFVDLLPSARAYSVGECNRLRTLNIEERGKSFRELLEIIGDEVNRIGINSSSGAGFAYIPGGGLWTSAIADMLAAATNRYAGIFFSSPGAVIIENQMIRWLCTLIGYPVTAHGNLSSGGSIANLTAIQTARDACKINSTNVGRSVIYSTAHVHHCMHKALHTTGLSDAIHRVVPMNPQFQMDAEALGEMVLKDKRIGLYPFLVVVTAGTTDTGAIDPLDAIADLCEEHNVWLHIDAAYGGFFMLVDEFRGRFKGIERSDSVVMDPHKGMFLPFGTGVVLVREPANLLKSYSHNAHYMQDALGFDEISPADAGPELSKHFRGLRMWLPLHLHGVDPFKANLEEKVLLCRHFYEGITRLGFETGPEPELSITLFRYPAKQRDEFNRKLLNVLRADGRCLFSSTEINGEYWIRCCVLNFRSHLKEINLALAMIEENVAKLG